MKLPKIRILLADDHFFVRLGLAGSLDAESDMSVIAQAGTGAEAVALFRRHQPDVLVLDRRLPDFDGTEAARRIRAEFPAAQIVMLTVDQSEEDIHAAIAAGASAYLPKSTDRAELLRAIRAVAAGGRYFPPAIAERLAARAGREPISPRELEVLRQIVLGKANKEIADALSITEATVKMHVSHLLEKLDAPDRTRAAIVAVERGIVRLE